MDEKCRNGGTKLWENQIKKYELELYTMRKENKEYYYLIQNLKRLLIGNSDKNGGSDGQNEPITGNYLKIEKEIKRFKLQMKCLRNEIRSIHDKLNSLISINPPGVKLSDDPSVGDDINELKHAVAEILELTKNSNLPSAQNFCRNGGKDGITFRDLQKVSSVRVGEDKRKKWGPGSITPDYVHKTYRQTNTDIKLEKPISYTKDNSSSNPTAKEKDVKEAARDSTNNSTKKSSLSFPFFKRKD